ncbi:hypothetical protein PR003_g33693, partial [Phytophthora rubi]
YRARLPRVPARAATNLVNAECSDAHVVFARGSGEMQGLGLCGEPLVSGITSNLDSMSVSSYAVNYAASMPVQCWSECHRHDQPRGVCCPNTVFELGGYSQGASATDIAIGVKTTLGSGDTIPENLASLIKAVVTFGNPLKMMGQTIERPSQTYGPIYGVPP